MEKLQRRPEKQVMRELIRVAATDSISHGSIPHVCMLGMPGPNPHEVTYLADTLHSKMPALPFTYVGVECNQGYAAQAQDILSDYPFHKNQSVQILTGNIVDDDTLNRVRLQVRPQERITVVWADYFNMPTDDEQKLVQRLHERNLLHQRAIIIMTACERGIPTRHFKAFRRNMAAMCTIPGSTGHKFLEVKYHNMLVVGVQNNTTYLPIIRGRINVPERLTGTRYV